MENKLIPPCSASCPLGQDVRGYVNLVAEGRFEESLSLILATNPMPSVCGRICVRDCESNCRRSAVDRPVAIRALKRFIADRAGYEQPKQIKRFKEKVAVVGAGPAGLAAALSLGELGYSPTVFERRLKPGGLLASVIPSYRLPKTALVRDLERVTGGVRIRLKSEPDLRNLLEAYDAVIVAIGAPQSRKFNVPGENLDGVVSGMEFLEKVKAGKKVRTGNVVAVVGGGNTAFDAARTALRIGSKKVYLLYRRSADEIPANPEEIGEAVEEGIIVKYLVSPKSIVGRNGKVAGIICVRNRLSAKDSSGRRKPVPIRGSEFRIKADCVITALGQTSEPDKITADNVFYCGDAESGTSDFTRAMASGRQATLDAHKFLTGKTEGSLVNTEALGVIPAGTLEIIGKLPRQEHKKLAPKSRRNFREVNMCFDNVSAVKEALRCMNCGAGAVVNPDLCVACLACVKACPYEVPEIVDGVAFISPDKCQSCGICAPECPANAINMGNSYSYEGIRDKIAAGKRGCVLGFVCRFDRFWNRKGKGILAPKNARIVEVPCNGVIHEQHFLDAIEAGYSGVFLINCKDEDCRHYVGCKKSVERLDEVKRVLNSSHLRDYPLNVLENYGKIRKFAGSCER
ncbi:MAG: FAD-dependent oxidoreductase [Candidatus Altiarchaeota archaeon]